MTELNQKLTKLSHKTFNTGQGRLNGEKKKKKITYVRTGGLKRGEGVCSKGACFQELWYTPAQTN